MKLKGIIDYDCTNYKKPVLTLEFPTCSFKCDIENNCQVCQNNNLINEPDIEISNEQIWQLYKNNPLTKGFCCQGLEPFDSMNDLLFFIDYIRNAQFCNDDIIIYTGYRVDEVVGQYARECLTVYKNIIIKWGRFYLNNSPHYDELLGVQLASDNQYGEKIS